MEGTIYIEHFIVQPEALWHYLLDHAPWDHSMTARKTASYGVAYNYGQMVYPYRQMPELLNAVVQQLKPVTGFEANNCLINYYPDGKSKMGFHSDQTDILAARTGIAIVSLGATRMLRFRNIGQRDLVHDFWLPSGSLFYMSQEVQHTWQHAIPAADSTEGRLSLTFRNITKAALD